MSLNLQKLEQARKLEGGMVQARCPACAEGGHDRAGEHLRVYPDGKFGCCVHPKDREHRKRIFALVGVRERQDIKVRVAAKVGGSVQFGILGRLGRVFQTPIAIPKSQDATDGSTEVQPQSAEVRTLRTGDANSNNGSADQDCRPLEESRTLRTGVSNPYAYAEKVPIDNRASAYKEFGRGVRSVREAGKAVEPPTTEGEGGLESRRGVRCVREGEAAVRPSEPGEKLPFLTADGTLSIPFDSPERYHWWKGGQSIAETRNELRAGVVTNERRKHAPSV